MGTVVRIDGIGAQDVVVLNSGGSPMIVTGLRRDDEGRTLADVILWSGRDVVVDVLPVRCLTRVYAFEEDEA